MTDYIGLLGFVLITPLIYLLGRIVNKSKNSWKHSGEWWDKVYGIVFVLAFWGITTLGRLL